MQIPSERLAIVSDEANAIFGYPQALDGDYSLVALLRAIVLTRGNIPLDSIEPYVEVEKTRVRSLERIKDELLGETFAILVVECVNGFDEIKINEENWTDEFSFNGKPFPINRYLSQYVRSRIFVNETEQKIIAFVDRKVTHLWVQAFESTLCRLMPWYFPQELSEEDKAFFKALSVSKSADQSVAEAALIDFVNKAANTVNFREFTLRKQLNGIADKARKRKISSLKASISSVQSTIRELRTSLYRHHSDLDRYIMELAAYEVMEPNQDDSMFDFFKVHKNLTVTRVSEESLSYSVDDTLEFYDEDEFERIYNKPTSYIGRRNDSVRAALWAIFSQKKGIIRIQGKFELLDFKRVDPISRSTFIDYAMPNPHIYFHACSGGHDKYYAQYAESGDWDLAIEQSIAATKNINFGDHVVGNEMVEWLIDHDHIPCIYVEDYEPIEDLDKSKAKLVSFGEFKKNIISK